MGLGTLLCFTCHHQNHTHNFDVDQGNQRLASRDSRKWSEQEGNADGARDKHRKNISPITKRQQGSRYATYAGAAACKDRCTAVHFKGFCRVSVVNRHKHRECNAPFAQVSWLFGTFHTTFSHVQQVAGIAVTNAKSRSVPSCVSTTTCSGEAKA